MSLKLKIVLFISILVIVSLAATLIFLSFHEYKPVLKNEIINRIDSQLDYVTPDIFRIMRGEIEYSMLNVPTFRILNKNNEVMYLKILKGKKNKYLRYFGVTTKNRIIYQLKKADEKVIDLNICIDEIKNKKVVTSCDIIKIASSNNNTLNTEIPLYVKTDLKEFFKEKEKKYKAVISNINLMITKIQEKKKSIKKKKTRKMIQPGLDRDISKRIQGLLSYPGMRIDKINKILVKTKDSPVVKKINASLNTILEKDLDQLDQAAFPKKRNRTKRDYYSWSIINLNSVNKVLKKILSRLVFINGELLGQVSKFHEVEYDLLNNKKTEIIPIETINTIKFYKPIERFNEIIGVYEVGISEEAIMKKINPIIINGILSSSIFIIFSIGAALLLSLYLIFPIHVLEKGADEILKDLKYRIKLKRKDEFGKLANTFNHLSKQLTEELSKYQKLYKEATEDELTKLMVRRYFMKILESEINNAAREKRPTSLFMTDIDYFKKFNDTYGHQTGDIVLGEVAGIIIKNTRKNRVRNDIAGRYGGEEFAVLLPDTDKEEALKCAERIRREIERMRLKSTKRKTLRVTISIGVSTSKKSDITPKGLIEKADKALYKAKESGRNKVSYE